MVTEGDIFPCWPFESSEITRALHTEAFTYIRATGKSYSFHGTRRATLKFLSKLFAGHKTRPPLVSPKKPFEICIAREGRGEPLGA